MLALIFAFLFCAVANAQEFSVAITEQELPPEASAKKHFEFDVTSPPNSITTERCGRREDNCYEDPAEFAQQCKLSYGGFANGGRCFFYVPEKGTWDQAFDKCAKKQADVVQYHTTEEFNAFTAHLRAGRAGAEHIWTALRRHQSATGSYSMPLFYSWWFKTPTEHHNRLSAGNTWVRLHEKDDPFASGQPCLVTYSNHARVGDYLCAGPFATMCVVHNKAQTFLYIKDMCNGEVPIETYYDISIRDCAVRCVENSIWCRSFNYWEDNRCELLSFVVSDTIQKYTDKSKCFHYSYKS